MHTADGPAVISPDGVECRHLRGHEITVDIESFFAADKRNVKKGLDTPEKLAAFQATFSSWA